MNKITTNFDLEEVTEFMAGLHITGIKKDLDMSDILERDNCRYEREAMREGRGVLTILSEEGL